MTTSKKTRKPSRRGKEPSPAKLDEMIEEAIVDAYGESEQIVGFYTMLEGNLEVPFKTEILGVEVTVERIDLTDDEQIIAVCSRGKAKQRVPLLDLPLPRPLPAGADWIAALRRWARVGR
jgi:Calcium binding